MPPRPPVAPQYPFQSVVCDFFATAGHTYVALADRYSNWVSIFKLKQDTSQELIRILRGYFATFGVPEIFSSDGASIFTSSLFKDFCKRWGIEQRISSAYHPRANKRAEMAVKQSKRLVQDSLGPAGTVDTDSLARALLAQRNTPQPRPSSVWSSTARLPSPRSWEIHPPPRMADYGRTERNCSCQETY